MRFLAILLLGLALAAANPLETQISERSISESYDCEWSESHYDGSGGSEIKIGYQTGDDCVNACIRRKIFGGDSTINGVTIFAYDRGGCWCERKMTGYKKSQYTLKTCLLVKPYHCKWSGAYRDGAGGTEVRIGGQTDGACVDGCVKKKLYEDSRINGVTVLSNGDPGCWCEKQMTEFKQSSKNFKTCFLESAYRCEWSGDHKDGSGGTEYKIGYISGQECVDRCIRRKLTKDPTINGVTVFANGEKGCWCEQGMTGQKSSSGNYKTCFLN